MILSEIMNSLEDFCPFRRPCVAERERRREVREDHELEIDLGAEVVDSRRRSLSSRLVAMALPKSAGTRPGEVEVRNPGSLEPQRRQLPLNNALAEAVAPEVVDLETRKAVVLVVAAHLLWSTQLLPKAPK